MKMAYQTIRKTWNINPASRKIESKKVYNRKNKEWKKDV